MTTQELGQQPGGARLGAFASRCRPHATMPSAPCAPRRGSWRVAVAVPGTGVANGAMGYMGTTDTTGLGFGLIKHTARPLGTRST